ncbi:MAG: hypothetical protein KC731_36450 [Myxococcales bacterium]|nr:hypothetical protein [Myxococcales bacterium]
MLNDETYAVDDAVVEAARGLGLGSLELRALTRMSTEGLRVSGRKALQRVLEAEAPGLGTGSVYEVLRRAGLDDDCGRGAFLVGTGDQQAAIVLEDGTGNLDGHTLEGADLDGASPPTSGAPLIDPEAGLFRAADIEKTSYVYGWPGPVGAAHYARAPHTDDATDISTGGATIDGATLSSDAVLEIAGDATHLLRGPVTSRALTLRARIGSRPHVRLDDDVVVTASGDEATLVLDGLWLGARAPRRLILRGDFEVVALRHCTLDPGEATTEASLVELVVEGSVESLELTNCLLGCLRVDGGFIGSLVVTHCGFLPVPGRLAIETGPGTALHLTGSTITGPVMTHRLFASDTIFSSTVSATDLQNGCVRYSAAPAGEALPRPYHVVRLDVDSLAGLFSSTSLGSPQLLRLAARAPIELQEASSIGGETGLWGLRRDGAKLESVAAKVEEFLPVGLIAVHLRET